MRLTISVDPALLHKAQKAMKQKTKTATIELGLKELLKKKGLERVIRHLGQPMINMTLDELLASRRKE